MGIDVKDQLIIDSCLCMQHKDSARRLTFLEIRLPWNFTNHYYIYIHIYANKFATDIQIYEHMYLHIHMFMY